MDKLLKIIFLTILVGCGKSSEQIDKITIYYLPENVQTQISVDCDGHIFRHYNLLNDTLIDSQDKIDLIEKQLEQLKPVADDYGVDVRIHAYIDYVDNSLDIDTICFDKFGHIIFNGEKKKNNPELFEIFRETVW